MFQRYLARKNCFFVTLFFVHTNVSMEINKGTKTELITGTAHFYSNFEGDNNHVIDPVGRSINSDWFVNTFIITVHEKIFYIL